MVCFDLREAVKKRSNEDAINEKVCVFESKKVPTVFCSKFSSLLCKCSVLYCLPLLLLCVCVDMNEIKSLTVYKDLYRFFFCSEYMYVSVHIYKHLALFFFLLL